MKAKFIVATRPDPNRGTFAGGLVNSIYYATMPGVNYYCFHFLKFYDSADSFINHFLKFCLIACIKAPKKIIKIIVKIGVIIIKKININVFN